MDTRVTFVIFSYTETSGRVHAEQLLTCDIVCRISSSYGVRRVTGLPSSATNPTHLGLHAT